MPEEGLKIPWYLCSFPDSLHSDFSIGLTHVFSPLSCFRKFDKYVCQNEKNPILIWNTGFSVVYQTILGSGNLGSKVGERNLGTNN